MAAGAAALVSCAEAPAADLTGTSVEVLGVWEDDEAARFVAVLEDFERRTGADVTYTSTEGEDIAAVLEDRLATGGAPDVAVLPQPGLLRSLAADGLIEPLDDLLDERLRSQFQEVWLRLATVEGHLYGVWFKAANKSLVWYAIGALEVAGLVPPDDLDGFVALADAVTASGTPAFAVAGADAWTLTDWFENAYLHLAGPERYDALAERRLPWTDPSVHRTLELLGRLLAPEQVAGGPAAALDASFTASVAALASRPPAAAMVVGADFVRGALPPGAEVGVDVDVFPFPLAHGSGRGVVAGGDVAVLMRASAGGRALVRHLATPGAGEVWAALGGFLSPNEDVDLRAYPDPTTRRIARTLLEAGDDLRFDLSDLQPVEFGGTTGQGMLAALQDFLRDTTAVAATAQRLEDAATSAVTGG